MLRLSKKRPLARQQIENRAMIGAIMSALVIGWIGFFVLQINGLIDSKLTNLGLLLALVSAAVVFLAFGIGYAWAPERIIITGPWRRLRTILVALALGFVHSAIAFLLIVALSNIAANYLGNIELDSVTAIIASASITAVCFYSGFILATSMNSSKLVMSLVIFCIAGILTSIITTGDSLWWTHHFSALGAGTTPSSYAFNLTLILGGVVIASLADYLVSDLRMIESLNVRYSLARSNLMRWSLVLIGVCMAGVALFPYDRFLQIHNIFGYGMSLLFLIMIAFLPIITPIFSKLFYAVSYFVVGLVIFSFYAWKDFGLFSFTTFELLGTLIIFVWLTLFVRQINAAYSDNKNYVARRGYPIAIRHQSNNCK